MLPKLLTTLLIVIAPLLISAQVASTDKRFAGLDTAFARTLKDLNAVGFSVAVIEKNKIVYSNGFGYSKLEQKEKATPQTMLCYR